MSGPSDAPSPLTVVAFPIEPDTLYERRALARSLGLGANALNGSASVKLGAKVFILGRWLLAWFEDAGEDEADDEVEEGEGGHFSPN